MKITEVFVVLAMATSASAQPATQTILFVCEHGAAKSVVAAAHFNRLAADRGLPFRAVSRGTVPDPTVPPRIVDGLKGEGLSAPTGFAPSLVTAADLKAASRVVMFDVTLPAYPNTSPITRWDGLPAFSDAYGPASAAIAAKIDGLLRELAVAARKK